MLFKPQCNSRLKEIVCKPPQTCQGITYELEFAMSFEAKQIDTRSFEKPHLLYLCCTQELKNPPTSMKSGDWNVGLLGLEPGWPILKPLAQNSQDLSI